MFLHKYAQLVECRLAITLLSCNQDTHCRPTRRITSFNAHHHCSHVTQVVTDLDAVTQVYLGKWQETDVAVKVLIEMQQLAPNSEVQPQDPATLEPWKGNVGGHQTEQGGKKRGTAGGLIGITAADASLTGFSTVDTTQDMDPEPEGQTAIKTLEREVHLLPLRTHSVASCSWADYSVESAPGRTVPPSCLHMSRAPSA